MKLKDKYKREYRIWKGMRSRVNAPCFSHLNYQKKGIKCCRRWNSFEHFLSDMGPCPEGYSLDRIDNDGNYEPDNCRWASIVTQTNNRGNFNINIHYKDETHTLKEWCKILKLKYNTIYSRMFNMGMSFESAITYVDPRDELLLWNNKYYSKQELGKIYNIPMGVFYDRRRRGWPLSKILNTPVKSKHT
jgi:hypothetical protein